MDRVLIFLPCLTLGGAERQGLLVADYLTQHSREVEVWGFPPASGKATLIPDLERRNIPYQQLLSWPQFDWRFSTAGWSRQWLSGRYRWANTVRTYARNVPQRRFDVVIAFTFWPALIACLLANKFGGTARIYWNHRGGYDDAGVLYNRFLLRQILAARPRFVANSTAGALFLRDTFRLDRSGVTVIPNAWVADDEVATYREEDANHAAPTDVERTNEISLIHVANFFPEKDYDTLLRAVRILTDRGLRCHVHFCGSFMSASDEKRFLDAVRQLSVDRFVTHQGSVSRGQILRLLPRFDIGILSSRSEGQPNAIMEYMAASLPVIATRIPGAQEVLGELNADCLFDVGNAEQLAALVQDMAANPERRAERGRQNRTRLLEQFAPEHIFPRWLQLVQNKQTGSAD